MKKNTRFIYLLEIIILFFIIIFEFIFVNNFKNYSELIYIVFWALVCFFSLLRLRFPEDKNFQKNNTVKLVIICLLSAIIFVYGLGLLLGYSKTVFAYNILSIIKNLAPIWIVIISQEVLRYIVAKNSFKSLKPIYIITILFVIVNIIIEINNYNFYNFEQIFKFVCVTVMPIMAREALYSYLSYKVSIVPTLVCRTALESYPFVLPFYPSLGNYFVAIIGVTLPYAIYAVVKKSIEIREKSDLFSSKYRKRILYFPIVVFVLITISLVSGLFTHKMISIGSNSMVPVFARGDTVIYRQYKDDEYKKAKVGDILVFMRNNVIITHRIIKISKKEDITYFKTKGDANENEDAFVVPQSDVLGVVEHRVKYIGYPTIWLSESVN